jgi:ThiF family protein
MPPEFLSHQDLGKLKEKHPELFVDDQIHLAIDELFDIEYPAKKDIKTEEEVKAYGRGLTGGKPEEWGSWVYYPWLNRVVHVPPQAEYRALRTSRNRNLITAEEQKKLYGATILVIGMSVGSNVVEALVSQGVGGKLILVDMDMIEPSNLNRIRSPYHHVGLHKVEAISRKAWEVDPYLDITGYRDGLTEANLPRILKDHPVGIIVDEMDELRMKVLLREAAKAHKLPVIMAADDGDDSLLDIERYDLDETAEIFGGRIPADIIARIKDQKLSRPEIGAAIGKYFVGPENIPLRMYKSLGEVGKTLPSWPQLGGAAALSGVALTYTARKIILGEGIRSGRHLISLDEKLDMEKHTDEYRRQIDKFRGMMEGS